MGRIVVGVDGSEHSLSALRWAAAQARAHGYKLHVIHSWTFPTLSAPRYQVDQLHGADLEDTAKRILDEAIEGIGGAEGLEIEREVANDPPARALIAASEGADLLVVGARGTGGFLGLRLGSVSHQCALHAHCPVVIIPQDGA